MSKAVVCFGDSLTQRAFISHGWGVALGDSYLRILDVYNRGYSGYNTRYALELITDELQFREEEVLYLVFYGANDATEPTDKRHHVSLEDYKQNLASIVTQLSSRPGATVLLLAPPPIDKEKILTVWEQAYRSLELSGSYASAVVELAAEKKMPVIDVWTEFQEKYPDSWKELLNDGLHFSDKGNQALFELILAKLKSDDRLHAFNPVNLAWRTPACDDIDLDDIPGTFKKHKGLQIR